jgi:hypothetical protein
MHARSTIHHATRTLNSESSLHLRPRKLCTRIRICRLLRIQKMGSRTPTSASRKGICATYMIMEQSISQQTKIQEGNAEGAWKRCNAFCASVRSNARRAHQAAGMKRTMVMMCVRKVVCVASRCSPSSCASGRLPCMSRAAGGIGMWYDRVSACMQ